MANDDNLDLEFNVNGDGERAIERIKGKLRDLGTTAEYASQKQVDGANDALAKYRQEADVLDEIAQKEARIARAAAQTKVASNRITASNATTAATVANAGSTAGARADLAIQRVLTEEVRGTNLEREQENRNILTAGKLLTEQERQQNLIQQRTIAAAREEERAIARIASAERARQSQAIKDEQTRSRLIESRAGRERTAALSAERSRAAVANGSTTERTSALRAERGNQSLDIDQANSLRYALYDTAQVATLAGVAIAGIGVAAGVAGAQAEQQFANLSATIGDTTYDLGGLNQELLDLTTSSPVNLADAVGVAQLGAQMNIAERDLASFTTTVTQFSATTNVSSEQAAESFGRISQLLKVNPAQFKNLSSSIYQVGVDSVATESQILKTAEEISGSAAAYGFAADSVVGLSGAFASLAIQPEQARGATTRIFNEIESAVKSGGPELENYARIAGTSAEEIQKLWRPEDQGGDPAKFFQMLVNGLAQSKDRLQDIQSIGATGVYDTNVLQRLASNSDFLAKSLDTAKSSFSEGTAAGEAYAKATDTVLARLQELGNSLVELGVNAGGPLLQALSPIIDLAKFLVNSFADFPPVVLGSLAALTLFAGGYVLLKGATATAIAATIGFRFVLSQLQTTGTEAGLSMATLREQIRILSLEMRNGAGAATQQALALDRANGSSRGLAAGQSLLGGAMKAVGWLAAIGLAAQMAQGLYGTHKASIMAANGFGVVANAAKGADLSTKEIVESFRNAKEQLSGIDQIGSTNALASFFGDLTGTTDYTKQAKEEIKAVDDLLADMVSNGNAEGARDLISRLGLQYGELASLLPGYKASLEDAGQGELDLADKSNTAAENLTAFEAATKSAKESVDQLFGALNQQSDFGAAIQQLFSGIYDGGTAFDYLSESGRANLANLQAAIESTIVYAQQSGVSTTDALGSLFAELAQKGVNTDAIFRALAASPYEFKGDIDMSAVQKKVAAFLGGGSIGSVTGSKAARGLSLFNGQIGALSASAPRASTAVGGLGSAAKKAGKAAAAAAKEVKTLNDYASDLNTVFSDATKYRFGVSDALEDISSQWRSVRDSMADQAKQVEDNRKKNREALAQYRQGLKDTRVEIRGIRSDLQGLEAQLAQKKYFLSIAVQYGDSLRGQQLSADIADINSQIADKTNDLSKAQKDLKTPFEATTVNIDKQKKSLGDLYEAYQDAIVEYARSGMSQDELGRKTEELRQDFIRQAKQAGYSTTEINKYSQAFDDLAYSIRHVPRKITVGANVGPAQRALADFLAKANASKASPSVDSPGAGAAGRRAGVEFTTSFDQWFSEWQNSFNGTKRAIQDITNNISKIKIPDLSKLGQNLGVQVGRARGGFTPGVNAFPIGGFVPGLTPADRRKDNMLGMVPGGGLIGLQGGEPIINNAARSKYGDEMFEAINALRFQPSVVSPNITVQGGGSGTMTELSPYDRSILQEIAARVGITIGATALQQAVGAGNVASRRRKSG